ncbi:MAG: type II toxin-antitoxin system Phd/YefM family antitoxin [Chloroflexi bacterium]|nr:type II toxin-antitoxin system Phd/YefM family antitoxin [Chloroflexota bacterium]
MTTQDQSVTLSEFKRRLGEIVKRAAYGRERIILLSHGKPSAALISMEDFHRLQTYDRIFADETRKQKQFEALARARKLREEMARSGKTIDSTAMLTELREERTDELMDLR